MDSKTVPPGEPADRTGAAGLKLRRSGPKPLLGNLRIAAVYLFLALLLWRARPTWLTVVAGLPFLAAGAAIRMWAAGHLVKSDQLITTGPYARLQHPLYLGRLLILTGFGLIARIDFGLNLWLLGIGYAVFFLYYYPRKLRVEGGRLRQLHGERWVSYDARVPRLFPALRRFPGAAGRRWSWRRAVHNREPFFLLGLLVVLALFLLRLRLAAP